MLLCQFITEQISTKESNFIPITIGISYSPEDSE